MFKYAFLGIAQGLTEFLPVSSSAHLLILQRLFGFSGEELAVSIILHLGTALALLIFFFRDILELLTNFKWLLFIFIVSVITGAIGILGKDFFESLFSSLKLSAIALIFTGAILLLANRFKKEKREMLGPLDALLFGLAQAAAIIPGVSRSGITISALLLRGVKWQVCFKFSFLAAIPAVFGAALLQAKKIGFAFHAEPAGLFVGFLFSLLSGLFALWFLRLILGKARLDYFGFYCILTAVIVLVFMR